MDERQTVIIGTFPHPPMPFRHVTRAPRVASPFGLKQCASAPANGPARRLSRGPRSSNEPPPMRRAPNSCQLSCRAKNHLALGGGRPGSRRV